jgi:transcriptional regulator with XRE-family HTH domain
MRHIEIDPDKLREARFRSGYSLRELAQFSNTNHNRIWEYEKGRRNPQPRTIRRLAEALGVEVPALLKERRG